MRHRDATPRHRAIRTWTLALVPTVLLVVGGAPAHAAAAPGGTPYELDAAGTSHVAWPFTEPTDEWWIATGSSCHETDDYYAFDWNWGNGDEDLGKLALAMAPGWVIFAGRNTGDDTFKAYGNQVVVQIVDEDGYSTDWAYRYAHLDSFAVKSGDYVHFGSEIGTVGNTTTPCPNPPCTTNFPVHLHAVLYKDIYNSTGTRTGIENLYLGYSPGAVMDCDEPIRPPTLFAAEFSNDGEPFRWTEENLPCSTWNGNQVACDAHSIPWGGQQTQDCAYYYCSGRCAPRGTSNCLAGCESYCSVPEARTPCAAYNGDVKSCDARALPGGYPHDCAYYLDSHLCRPRGTSYCLAGITAYCWE